MPTFHPAFDPITSTWFVSKIEAPSLRELKKLLPRRAKLKGYFPKGFTATRPTSTEQRTYMPIKLSFHMQSKRQPSKIKAATGDLKTNLQHSGKPRRYNHTKFLICGRKG